MCPDGQGKTDVGRRVTNVIEVRAELASDVECCSQNATDISVGVG